MAPPPEPIVYPSSMQAIAFPSAAAEEARTVCNRIASLLETDLAARATLVTEAQTDWEGRYRDEFDETWSPQSHRLTSEKESLRRLAGDLRDAIDLAVAMNASRAEARADYRAEHQPTPTGPNGPH